MGTEVSTEMKTFLGLFYIWGIGPTPTRNTLFIIDRVRFHFLDKPPHRITVGYSWYWRGERYGRFWLLKWMRCDRCMSFVRGRCAHPGCELPREAECLKSPPK